MAVEAGGDQIRFSEVRGEGVVLHNFCARCALPDFVWLLSFFVLLVLFLQWVSRLSNLPVCVSTRQQWLVSIGGIACQTQITPREGALVPFFVSLVPLFAFLLLVGLSFLGADKIVEETTGRAGIQPPPTPFPFFQGPEAQWAEDKMWLAPLKKTRGRRESIVMRRSFFSSLLFMHFFLGLFFGCVCGRRLCFTALLRCCLSIRPDHQDHLGTPHN